VQTFLPFLTSLSSPIMPIPSEKDLLNSAVHFGHRKEKWNPKMAPFLYGTRKGIHIFDLEKTRKRLEETCNALKKLQAEGKTILFVSTKQQSIPFIEHIAQVTNQPMVTKKWIPGLLTNWSTIKRRLKYYLDLQRSFQTGEIEKYTKKEQMALRKKLAKLDNALAGVSTMTGLPDAVFVLDAVRDRVAVLEARKLSIPLFGVCDSNADPDAFSVFIPGNDDAVKSIDIILRTVEEELLEVAAKKGAPRNAGEPPATPGPVLAAELRQKQA
jgi:small subunit ribosomal protein S2